MKEYELARATDNQLLDNLSSRIILRGTSVLIGTNSVNPLTSIFACI